jgi:hypothetical protein
MSMDLFFMLRKISVAGLKVSLKKAIKKIFIKKGKIPPFNESFSKSNFYNTENFHTGILHSFFSLPESEIYNMHKDLIFELSDDYFKHKFNLLGSGWTVVALTQESRKTNKISNISFDSSKISTLIPDNYKYIDWQTDFMSDYRWNNNEWYKNIRFGNIEGVDIKIPWELGRMQHLPVLAMAAALLDAQSVPINTNKYFEEIKHQILDFISSNPINFGSQWMLSMEVGIRAANWLISYDFLKNAGFDFGDEFNKVFINSIYEHGKYICENLEWSEGMRGNHYFANITGLLFIAAYLQITDETSSWLTFAIHEIIAETDYQFLPDGGNFEASTAYHCFATEMLFWAVALILSLPKEKIESLYKIESLHFKGRGKINFNKDKNFEITSDGSSLIFPDEFIQKFHEIGFFTQSILKKNSSIDQIGDNDSGYFFNISPWLSHNNLNNLGIYQSRAYLVSLFEAITKKKIKNPEFDNCLEPFIISQSKKFDLSQQSWASIISYPCKNQRAFSDFGLYIFKRPEYFLSIRCGSIGQKGKGGHSHNDQLSITLNINGNDVMVDPGTYTYTAFPDLRNKFRSIHYHNTLCIEGKEQNEIPQGIGDALFWLKNERTKAKVVKISDDYIKCIHYGYGSPHTRELTFNEKVITGTDVCTLPTKKSILFHLSPEIEPEQNEGGIVLKFHGEPICSIISNDKFSIDDYDYSPEYGFKVKSKVICINTMKDRVEWSIKI